MAKPVLKQYYGRHGLHSLHSAFALTRARSLRAKLEAGEPALLLGLGIAGHNAGASLVRVDGAGRLELLCNEEDERYSAIKHSNEFPARALRALASRFADFDVRPENIDVAVTSWDYIDLGSAMIQVTLEEFPGPLRTEPNPHMNPRHLTMATTAPARISEILGLKAPMPLIMMPHHDNHAYMSYALSPFASAGEPTLVAVVDGAGETCSSSFYEARGGELGRIETNESTMDSLGYLYGVLSSTQGGWPPLSSEGRYMGAAAWGDQSRLTNPYYRQLRQILYFGSNGEVRLNRRLANWHRGGLDRPYTNALTEILGAAIATRDMWNPDAVLNLDEVDHAAVDGARVDKAAALQLVFEDGLLHLIGALLHRTGATRLVLTGGTALNCVANMRLLEAFDTEWYRRQLAKDARLQLWIPPVPGDAGTPPGAAFAFAMRCGARPGPPLRHAFYCGTAPSRREIEQVLAKQVEIESLQLGNVSRDGPDDVADLLAYVVSRDGVIGLVQGAAETGPRALGHRSIFANPSNPATLRTINESVKYRERIRPLAPMMTLDAATKLFELAPGAAADTYNAYNYMVLAVRARENAKKLIPAVIHEDGTARVQIVRGEDDPLTYAFLRAMGRRIGVEVAVNTSLNVGAPMAQTAEHVMQTLCRARGMDGVVVVDTSSDAWLVWKREDGSGKASDRIERWRATRTARRSVDAASVDTTTG